MKERTLVVAACIALAVTIGSFAGRPATEGDAMETDLRIRKIAYLGWNETYELDNGLVRAVVVSEIGPRIIDFRLSGGENVFHVRSAEAGGKGESHWVFRGGWRPWIAPERKETTYALDNSRCQVETVDGSILRVTGPPQEVAGIQKSIDVSLARGEPRLHLESRIRNIGDRPRTYAPWSLSVMRPGGRAFAPLDVGALDAFDSVRRLLLWSYTEMHDPRYTFGNRLVQINQSLVAPAPAHSTGRRDDESKIGVDSSQGWAAYLLGDTLYLKRFAHEDSAPYPDGGATIEIYSSHEFLEVENLGPLATIEPGEEIVLREDWWLFEGAHIATEEAAALKDLGAYLERAPSLNPVNPKGDKP